MGIDLIIPGSLDIFESGGSMKLVEEIIKALEENTSDDVLKLPVGISTAENGCRHLWKTYTGLKETYVYCERCDEKRICTS